MFILQLTDKKETLNDIERICQHLLEHKSLINMMNTAETSDLDYILKPTFKADNNESQKQQHWEKFISEFIISNEKGQLFRFFRDTKTQALYFGTEDGFNTLRNM